MMQKRSYIIPEVTVENCRTSECLMIPGISTGKDPAPKRRTTEVF